MVTLQVMDTIFNEAQRQGRLPFYVTSSGEEAINIASAAPLSLDDVIMAQVSTTYIHVHKLLCFPFQHCVVLCYGSIASPEFYYGVDSHCKNLPTNCLETNLIMGKAGRWVFIMGLINSTMSPFLRLSRTISIPH